MNGFDYVLGFFFLYVFIGMSETKAAKAYMYLFNRAS